MTKDINISDYDYYLPDERIAQHPSDRRENSRLLISKGASLSEDMFFNIGMHLPHDTLLVFNNTRVIKARLLFRKKTGAAVEILCLGPVNPAGYTESFSSMSSVEWECVVGNLKKWKTEPLGMKFIYKENEYVLTAEKTGPDGESVRIRFSWNCDASFGEVIEATGHIPLPPYIDRADEQEDSVRYQTVYSKIDGSIAAPTAGLHFTKEIIESLEKLNISAAEVTLHVGAGTFKPVKQDDVRLHEMHHEHFSVDEKLIEQLLEYEGKIIPVGTTSVRTIESLYWLGVKIINGRINGSEALILKQWEAYELPQDITVRDSLGAVRNFLIDSGRCNNMASTGIMIVPGYRFRLTDGLITNFHQPRSTLLLLISAFTGERWKEIYKFAIEKGFRFLSYGDSSLLLR